MHVATASSPRIRPARDHELAVAGDLVASAYANLPGLPGPDDQPAYYAMLRDAETRARNPAITVLVAVDDDERLLGTVDFIADMRHYGADRATDRLTDAAGIRLLAVHPDARGRGLGRALTSACIRRARDLGRARVVLHTTRAMTTAWAMYRHMGFQRFAALDFLQGDLPVFGFQLELPGA